MALARENRLAFAFGILLLCIGSEWFIQGPALRFTFAAKR
jgi:hypothetical protein